MIVQMCRASTGVETAPLLVMSMREKPADVSAYESFFRCQLQFGAQYNAFLFDSEDVLRPLPTADTELMALNEAVVGRYITSLDKDRIDIQIHRKLIELLPNGRVTLEDLADALHASVRTIQRRLEEQGTTYEKLLSQIRLDLAKGYLRDSRHTLTDITYLLGYSDQANFGRAFRRWTSVSPRQFRLQAQGGA